eukprot:s464_g20.t1
MQEKKTLYAKKVKEELGHRDGGYQKDQSGHDKTPSTSMPCQVGGNVQDHTMSQTPGRKASRKAEMTAEEKEFIEKKEEEEDWQKDYIALNFETTAEPYIFKSIDILEETYGWRSGF